MTGSSPNFTIIGVDSAGDDAICNGGHCTLRGALELANVDPGTETIKFAIGTGAAMISPHSALPIITGPVILDATTQPGYAGRPLIRLDGAAAGPSTPGFEITAGSSTVRGFAITNFTWDGVKLHDGGGNTVEDNDIGVFPEGTGLAAGGNGTYGVLADFGSTDNVIQRNVIGANGFGAGGPSSGIGIWHGADDNVVERNNVGAAPAGTAYPNAIGVIVAEASGARVAGNTITHNAGPGVTVFGTAIGNRIVANSIDANDGIGIDLGLDGVTPNDEGDADSGPNTLQNFPIITDVSSVGGTTTVTGTVAGITGPFDFDLYRNDACDGSGHGEGATHLAEGLASVEWTVLHDHPPRRHCAGGIDRDGDRDRVRQHLRVRALHSRRDGRHLRGHDGSDTDDGACSAANCSLREAVAATNAAAGPQTILFAIPPSGPQTIALTGVPIQITDRVTIDATSQTGQPHGIVVNAAGLNTMSSAQGALHLAAGSGGSILRGLVVGAADTTGS